MVLLQGWLSLETGYKLSVVFEWIESHAELSRHGNIIDLIFYLLNDVCLLAFVAEKSQADGSED